MTNLHKFCDAFVEIHSLVEAKISPLSITGTGTVTPQDAKLLYERDEAVVKQTIVLLNLVLPYLFEDSSSPKKPITTL